MKKLLAILFMFFLVLPRPVAAQAMRLVFIDSEALPFIAGRGPDISGKPGLLVDLTRLAAQPDFTLMLHRVPIRRLVDEIRFGRADGIVGIRYAPERLADLRFPMRGNALDPDKWAARLNHSLYRLQGGAVQWDGRTLSPAGAAIGVPSGLLVGETLRSLGADVVEVVSTRQLFSMLALGRISGVGTIDLMGDAIGQNVDGRRIEKLEPPLQVGDFYVAISPAYYAAHGPAVERFWQRIEALRGPTYARLLPQYLSEP